jgi:putative ABC transport system substrate-binding protein
MSWRQKGLELLHELVPQATLIAALFNPSNRNAELDTPAVQAAADALSLRLLVLHVDDLVQPGAEQVV